MYVRSEPYVSYYKDGYPGLEKECMNLAVLINNRDKALMKITTQRSMNAGASFNGQMRHLCCCSSGRELRVYHKGWNVD